MDDDRVLRWLREMQSEVHEYADMKAHAVDVAELALKTLAMIREVLSRHDRNELEQAEAFDEIIGLVDP